MFSFANDVRVLVVGESPLARAGLSALLGGQAGLVVVGQAAADSELPTLTEATRPDVLAWDLGWEPARALELLSDLAESGCAILALLADAGRAAEVHAAGARGLLPQDADPETLAVGLLAVARGLAVASPPLLSAALPARPTDNLAPPDTLTPREAEVLALMAEGMPNKQIAGRLKISEHTVKFHVNAIMGKLGVQSRTEAVVRATRLGLISL